MGHLVVAVNVRHALDLDVVLLVVANDPWQKSGARQVTAAADRLAMVEAAVGDVEGLEASDLEMRPWRHVVHRRHPGGAAGRPTPMPSCSWCSAATPPPACPPGSAPTRCAAVRGIVVVTRPGAEDGAPPAGWDWTRVECPRLEVSSTDLRDRVVDGRPLDYLLPPAVIDCIEARGLYR